MVTDSKYSDGNTNYLVVSDRQKNANDRELAKDAMVYYYNMNTDDEERWVKINENFDIHAGRWPQIENVAPAVSFSSRTKHKSWRWKAKALPCCGQSI